MHIYANVKLYLEFNSGVEVYKTRKNTIFDLFTNYVFFTIFYTIFRGLHQRTHVRDFGRIFIIKLK